MPAESARLPASAARQTGGIMARLPPRSQERRPGAAGHVLGIVKNYQKPVKYTYYAGSAWSKNDVRTMDEWVLRVNTFLDALHNPLKVTVE